jgi:NTE family protein
VQINPLEIDATPTSARRILERVTEIGFNASLMQELRAIEFVGRMLDEGSLDPKRYRKFLVHLIHGEDALEAFGASSRLNAEWAFLQALFAIGRTMAGRWLDRHAEELGERSTVDLRALID